MNFKKIEIASDEMHIYEMFPFTIVTDSDGTPIVFIRSCVSDDSLCDVIYCSQCLYPYFHWTFDGLQQWVYSYCSTVLHRSIKTIQETKHIILGSFDITDFEYGVNGLKRMRI